MKFAALALLLNAVSCNHDTEEMPNGCIYNLEVTYE